MLIDLLVFQIKLAGNNVISTNLESNFDEFVELCYWKNWGTVKFVIRQNNKKPQQKIIPAAALNANKLKLLRENHLHSFCEFAGGQRIEINSA